jgi:hypothetical protein
MEYGEEPRSAADKGVGLNANWNKNGWRAAGDYARTLSFP